MKILCSAGELSGDEHLAGVLLRLRELVACEATGMGGAHSRRAGMRVDVDIEKFGGAMGFIELLPKLSASLEALRTMKRALDSTRPDLLLLVDYPDFNLRLARAAKERNIPVLYFITPKLWAWRQGRVELFKKFVDCAAVIFPFEERFFRSKGYQRALFVGHPFCDTLTAAPLPAPERAAFLAALKISPTSPILAVFPGSRSHEIRKHMQPVCEAAALLRRELPNAEVVVNLADTVREEVVRSLVPSESPLKIVRTDSITLLRAATAGLLKSGTSNLQAAFVGLPFSMFFKATGFGAFVVRNFVQVKEYSLVNVLRPGTVREILQEAATGPALAAEGTRLLTDFDYRKVLQQALTEVRATLGAPTEHPVYAGAHSAAARVAHLAVALIERRDLF